MNNSPTLLDSNNVASVPKPVVPPLPDFPAYAQSVSCDWTIKLLVLQNPHDWFLIPHQGCILQMLKNFVLDAGYFRYGVYS